MSAGRERPGVFEVQVLGNEESSGVLRGAPDDGVALARYAFVRHRVDVVPQARQQAHDTGSGGSRPA